MRTRGHQLSKPQYANFKLAPGNYDASADTKTHTDYRSCFFFLPPSAKHPTLTFHKTASKTHMKMTHRPINLMKPPLARNVKERQRVAQKPYPLDPGGSFQRPTLLPLLCSK